MNELQKLMKLIDMIEKGKGLALSSVLEETQKVKDENSKIIENIDEIVGYIKALNEKVDSIPLNEEIGKLADRLNKEISKLAENTEKTQNDKMSRAEKTLLGKIDKLAKELRDEMAQITPDVYFEETKELIEKEIDPKDLAPKLEPEIDIQKLKNYKEFDEAGITKGVLDKALTILDQRTSFLINKINNLNTGSGSSTFLDLTDTPSSFSGEALKVARVNAGETALEFVALAGGGDALTTDPLSQFASTTSAQLAGVISDETGSGALVFGTSPTIATPTLTLKQSTTPTPTAEGAIEWDTDNNQIVIGDGTGQKTFSADDDLSITESQISDLGTYLENVVEDTTPQLGGDLDINGNSIVSVGAVDVNISPAVGRSVLVNTADFQVKNSTSISHRLVHNGSSYLGNGTGGIRRIGFGQITSPTASIHIGAGSTAASSAPIKLTAGTNMTTPEAGAIEYDGTDLFFTDGTATRRTILNNSDIGSSVQAWDTHLDDIAGLTPASSLIIGDGLGGWTTITPANFKTDNNILDTADIGSSVQAFDALLDDIADLVDPNADRLLFWDDSDGIMQWLTVGSNLRLTGTTLDVQDYYLLNTGDVGTGVYDFGGATSFEIPNGAGGTTVDAAGEVTVDTTSGTVNFHDGTAERVLTPIQSKSITIESPTSSEDISMFYTDEAITITKIVAVLVGSSTPSVTWTLRHGTDRSGTGAEAVTSGTTTTSTTTGSVVTSFNDATVVADSFLWCETTAMSGTVDQLNITVFYRQDA